ncbi:MAG: ATP-binding protein [Bacteroidales bacterium]
MHPEKITCLINSSQELVEKWNAKYSEVILACFQEQLTVLDNVLDNVLEVQGTIADSCAGEDETANNSQNKRIYDFHNKNLSHLDTIYLQLKSRIETKDLALGIVSSLLAEINQFDAYTLDVCHSESDAKQAQSRSFLQKSEDLFYSLKSTLEKLKRKKQGDDNKNTTRQHVVYYQDIIKGFLLDEYVHFIQNLTFQVQQKLIRYAISVFEIEDSLLLHNSRTENVLEKKEKLNLKDLLSETDSFFPKHEAMLLELFEKSGTIELPAAYIKLKAKRSINKANSQLDAAVRLWDRTFYTFYEDWRFREEISVFVSGTKMSEAQTRNSYNSKLSETLLPFIEQKREYLEQLEGRVPDEDNLELADLKHFFTTELYQLKKDTRDLSFKENLDKTSAEITKLLQKVGLDVAAEIDNLPEKSAVVRSPDYQNGIRKAEIYFFSPAEFIGFDSVPPFLNKINAINQNFTSNFDKIVVEFSDFDHITDFTMDTAMSMVNAQNNPEQTTHMFKEGIKRSLNILSCIAELVDETINKGDAELSESFAVFVDNVKRLDDNDRILSIYSNLLKSKAIQQSKEKKDKAVSMLLSSFSGVTTFVKTHTDSAFSYYKGIRKKLKLDKAPITVSSEISNYLAEINKRIYDLPVIYRYLFENAPVKEENLFLSREREVELLDKAFKDWKAGYFAATLLIGENGSGKSSLLHHYLKTVKGGVKVLYLHIDRFYYQDCDFYLLMQDIFANDKLKTDSDILEQINIAQGQQVIVLDGLERAFLRKPGGFNCLHKLLSLIISTNNQVFWICSVSMHACTYLEKTISLKENFDYLITLNNLSSSEIESIIMKRHRLSGYVAKYEDNLKPEEERKKIRDRQAILEKQFFVDLNKFADSNISLSMYFWLESISEFTDKELYIKKFKSPDFRFIETLSAEKIYTLLIIVLHGRINIETYTQVCGRDQTYSRKILTVLKEDSIVVVRGNNYMLNGVLYRHVVQLLRNKNLIH